MNFILSSGRTFRGEWWLPGRPDATALGVLHCDPTKGVRLEIDLPDGGDIIRALYRGTVPDVVHGRTSDGLDVSVCGCVPSIGLLAEMILRASSGTVTILAAFALGGLFAPSLATPVVSRAMFGWPGLEGWLKHKSIEISTDTRPRNLHATLAPSDPATFELPSRDLHVEFLQEGGIESDRQKATLWRRSAIVLGSDRQLSIDELFLSTRHSSELASICSSHSTSVNWIDLCLSNQRGWIWFQPAYPSDSNAVEHLGDLLPIVDLDDDLGAAFSRWLELFPKVDPILQYLRAGRSARLGFLDVRFLFLIHAIEATHRVLHEGLYVNSTAFKTMLTRVRLRGKQLLREGGLPPRLRNAIYRAIEHANEYRLHERIRELDRHLRNKYGLASLQWTDD